MPRDSQHARVHNIVIQGQTFAIHEVIFTTIRPFFQPNLRFGASVSATRLMRPIARGSSWFHVFLKRPIFALMSGLSALVTRSGFVIDVRGCLE